MGKGLTLAFICEVIMDNEILLKLYKSQGKIIFGYLIKCGCSKEEAEDIVQDSFVKAIEYMDGISSEKLSSWLFTVALNNFRNSKKRENRIRQVNIDENHFLENLSNDVDIVEFMLSKENSKEIRSCLESLKDEYRTLLIFKYDMELSYKEISRLIGISEDTIKTYLYRARNEFKRNWRDIYE